MGRLGTWRSKRLLWEHHQGTKNFLKNLQENSKSKDKNKKKSVLAQGLVMTSEDR